METKKQIPERKKSRKRQNILALVMALLILLFVNIISYFLFTRFDLTAEKRYSLSPATKTLLKKLDDIVYFRVYLDGEFPAGFKRLRNETREMLDEFRAYTDNIQYEFINPGEIKDKKDRNNLYRQLVEKGLVPTDLQVRKDEGTSRQVIFPGAIVSYKQQEMPVQLLMSQVNTPSEAVLNTSVQALEYNLANTIRKLSVKIKPSVALIEGHGELNKFETADITNALKEYYDVDRVRIDEKLNSLAERNAADSTKITIRNKYDAIIIAKPDSVFSEKDKFIIDQYIMRGGKVLWLVDPVSASMDSNLQIHGETMGIARQLNIEDQLFKYGVRLNPDLVMDINALPIPVKTGQMGNKPQFEFYPWFFFPILSPTVNHPIVGNLNALKTEFISSIDTLNTPGVKKTVLLRTSRYSRVVNAPVLISLNLLQKQPDERLFRGPGQITGVLLEGTFPSLYARRLPPEISESREIGFLEGSKPTKMIVISDGDIMKNYYDYSRNMPYPLGYDRYTRETFGNKDLILNAIDYLCDDAGVITVRSRELKLRLLDMTRVNKSKTSLQVANTVLPVVIILILGMLQAWIRRKKYTKTAA